MTKITQAVIKTANCDKTKQNMYINLDEFRNYTHSKFQDRVEHTYKQMQEKQTLAHVREMKEKYFSLSHSQMDVYEMFKLLEHVHDKSDPDTNVAQIEHAYQTAEEVHKKLLKSATELSDECTIRGLFWDHEWESLPSEWQHFYTQKVTLKALYPHIDDWSWLPLVGFIHDLGKVMTLADYGGAPQWSVVGDTFPVGCPFESANVFHHRGFYKKSADAHYHAMESAEEYGIYSKNCGFDQVEMSFGHDEYMYKVAKEGTNIPAEGLYVIHYHSFYPWHTPQSGGLAYQKLASRNDWLLLPLLKAFQKADLYSKLPDLPPKELLEAKYKALLDKYIPRSKIAW